MHSESSISPMDAATSSSPTPAIANVTYQFGTRSILFIMTATAIVAAIVSPVARRLDPDQARGILGYLATVIVLATLIVVINGWKQRRMEKEAGAVCFAFSRRGKRLLPLLFLFI